MKTTITQVAFAIIIALISFCSTASAQEYFFDSKWEDGKVISRTKYEVGFSGWYEKTVKYEYTYADNDNFLTKKFYKWNNKKSEWIPQYCIERYQDETGYVVLQYRKWDRTNAGYTESEEKMIYQLDDLNNHFTYLAFERDNLYQEFVNSDLKNLLAENPF